MERFLQELSLTQTPVAELASAPSNARTHSKCQIRQIAKSIETFGFTNPVLIDCTNTIIAGHGRIEAARLLGLSSVPTIRLGYLTEVEIRALIIADNKLAENAGWNREILRIELQHLLTIESDFDVTVTGFEVAEIDVLIEEGNGKADAEDEIPLVKEAVSVEGDLWLLGKHRILCGNTLLAEFYERLMEHKKADVIFIDPRITSASTVTRQATATLDIVTSRWRQER